MAKGSINIQDGFLFLALKSGDRISIQLITGAVLEGQLKRFDRFAVILEVDRHELMIYKHGILSIDAGTIVEDEGADTGSE